MTGPAAVDPSSSPAGGGRRRLVQLVGLGLLLVGVVAVALALARGEGDGTTATPTTAGGGGGVGFDEVASATTAPVADGIGEGWAPEVRGRTPLQGFGEVAATITSGDGTACEVCLLSAATSEQRSRGLMEVTDEDLGGYDGMLFLYPADVDGGFWMRNTPSPLSLAYFAADGELVSTVDMTPCDDVDTCPSYPPDGPFAFALEVLQGRLPDVGVTGEATLRVDGTRCPEADAER